MARRRGRGRRRRRGRGVLVLRGCCSGGLRALRFLLPQQRGLPGEPLSGGRGSASLLCRLVCADDRDLGLDRREEPLPLRDHRPDAGALGVELREGRAPCLLGLLQADGRCVQPVLRQLRGCGDVMCVRRNLTRVLHRVDHVGELRAAHEQLNQIGALALVDRDEQSRRATLRDQALLLCERELRAVRRQLLLGRCELELRAVPGVDHRAEARVERVDLGEHLRGLGVLGLDRCRRRCGRPRAGLSEPHERERGGCSDESAHLLGFVGRQRAPLELAQHRESTGPPARPISTCSPVASARRRAR